MKRLQNLFIKEFGVAPDNVMPITGSGSNRQYFRLQNTSSKNSAIGTLGDDVEENKTFLYIDKTLRDSGVNVPLVYGVTEDCTGYLQEDLGDVSLLSLRNTPQFFEMLAKAIDELPRIQTCHAIDSNKCYPEKEMGVRQIMWDLNYFKYCFLKPAGVLFNESALEDDFVAFTSDLLHIPDGLWGFMYRDCQSRNIIVKDNMPYWIDFQSGRRGPLLYDVASLLWQAKASIPQDMRLSLAENYFAACQRLTGVDAGVMRGLLPRFVLFRTLQVLGAYGFRGLVERKSHFIESIPAAIKNLEQLIEEGVVDKYNELKKSIEALCDSPRFRRDAADGVLNVEVFSFSYKKGYPEDLSGNGGGFMFDCRGLHNPGRYEEYKCLTGLDAPVIDFLEKRGEVQPFLKSAEALTDATIERYVARGFSSLQIGFGCTGGQHRSVYCAQHLARHIAGKFGDKVRVTVNHREQQIKNTL